MTSFRRAIFTDISSCLLSIELFSFLLLVFPTGRQVVKLLLHWRSAPYYSPLLILFTLLFSCVAFSVI